MKEYFKDIKGLEGYYKISNIGNVFSVRSGRNLTPRKTTTGYYTILLPMDGKHKSVRIHRLVAETFIPNPDNLPQVNHKNENKTDNRVENLEWCDAKYNSNYNGLQDRINRKHYIILGFDGVHKLGTYFQSTHQAARELGIHHCNILACLNGTRKTTGGYKWEYAKQ